MSKLLFEHGCVEAELNVQLAVMSIIFIERSAYSHFCIYRLYSGTGYEIPPTSLWVNRLRTARIWTRPFHFLTNVFVGHNDINIGPTEEVIHI